MSLHKGMTSNVSLMKVGSLVTRGKNTPSRYWPISSVGQLIVDRIVFQGCLIYVFRCEPIHSITNTSVSLPDCLRLTCEILLLLL